MKLWRTMIVCTVVLTLLLTSTLASLSIQVSAVTYGDANGDGDVNMKDVLLVRKSIAGLGGMIDLIFFSEYSCAEDNRRFSDHFGVHTADESLVFAYNGIGILCLWEKRCIVYPVGIPALKTYHFF